MVSGKRALQGTATSPTKHTQTPKPNRWVNRKARRVSCEAGDTAHEVTQLATPFAHTETHIHTHTHVHRHTHRQTQTHACSLKVSRMPSTVLWKLTATAINTELEGSRPGGFVPESHNDSKNKTNQHHHGQESQPRRKREREREAGGGGAEKNKRKKRTW